MENNTAKMIEEQLHQLEHTLKITLQEMKIKELEARANTLMARVKNEEFKLSQMKEK